MYHNQLVLEQKKEESTGDEKAKVLFEMIWSELVNELGLDKMVFPKHIMWLCGAPGAGKTAMTKFIMESQGIESSPIRVGDLLNDPAMIERKNRGLLISDREVVKALLKLLLSENYSGKYALVDGFPRTTLQAHTIELLYDKMLWLRRQFENTEHFANLRRPVFHITVLYVDESVSVQRQLKRGRESLEYNQRVDRSGVGEILEVRNTDIDARKAHERYRIWNEQLTNCLRVIKSKFPFHFINAEGAEMAVQQSIIKELEYQSSQELADETFDIVRMIPLANEIKKDARHNLVKRLDQYQRQYPKQFRAIVDFMNENWLPIIKKQALTGHVVIRTEDEIFVSDSDNRKLSIAMALDILTERGYKIHIEYMKNKIPTKVNLETGDIEFKTSPVLIFNIKWPPPKIRYSIAAATTESGDGWTDSSLSNN